MARLKFRKILGSVSYQQGLLISLLLPSVHRRPSQSPAAFRTVLKILFCLKSAISAFFPGLIGSAVVIAPAAPLLNQRQVGTFYIYLLAVKQRLSHLLVQLIDSITAGHFYIKSLIPLEQGNKEKADNKNTANAEKETVVAANTANTVAIRFVFIIKTPNLTFLQITLHLGFIIHDEC